MKNKFTICNAINSPGCEFCSKLCHVDIPDYISDEQIKIYIRLKKKKLKGN